MYHMFFIHSSVDGHLGCFHVLAVENPNTLLPGDAFAFLLISAPGTWSLPNPIQLWKEPGGGGSGQEGTVEEG